MLDDSWELLLNHVNETGRQLLFTNSDGRHVIAVTVNPVAANQIIDDITEGSWTLPDLTDYLNTIAEDIIAKDFFTYEIRPEDGRGEGVRDEPDCGRGE